MRQLRMLALSALVCAAATAHAQSERLETLARVWAAVKFTHPAMLTRDVDWDGALVRAIPRVRTAANDADFAKAIDGMLHELGDPSTHLIESVKETASPDTPLIRHDGDVLIVSIGPAVDRNGYAVVQQQDRVIADEVGKSDAVVVDLSTASLDTEGTIGSFVDGADLWSAEPMNATQAWTTFYSGYAPQRGNSSGGYFSGLMLQAGQAMHGAKHAPKRLAFVTDGRLPLPASVVALWSAGKAAIISSAPVSNAMVVKRVPIGGGREVQIRGGEFAIPAVTADAINPSPIAAAVAFVRGTTPLHRHDATVTVPATHHLVESDYRDMVAPDLEHRLLACFRIWSTIAYFYPYKPLIGDWDAVLREFIPRFEQADGEVPYVQAVLEMTAHIEDGHTGAWDHPGLAKVLPEAPVPFRVDWVEGEPVVIEKYDPAAAISLGDVVVSVDGEPLAARAQRLRKYVAGATEAARSARVLNAALRGPDKSVAHLEVRGANGATRTVDIPRATSFPQTKSATPWRVLDGNIGYADLRQLTVSQVDGMFDALMKTKAIIFDMRGYPKGTAWAIAPRINTHRATVAALFRRPQFSGADTGDTFAPAYEFQQTLPTSEKPVYTGKVVVLIDDRAISQSEHSCLFFEQAAGATFIGTPTAGSNGDVTDLVLPGGFVVYFTGHDVRHADGRQLQRVGIQPDIRIAPTIAGLRAGKDEVLDRAVAFVNGDGALPPSAGIEEFNKALENATRQMDNAATLALWSDDGVSLLPSHTPIIGKKAIATFINAVTASLPAAHMESFQMNCHDIQTSGDLATEWCDEHQVVRFADGKPPFDGRGKMLLVLRKSASGQWLLKEEMWNQGTAADGVP